MSGKRLDKPPKKAWTTSKVIAVGILLVDGAATMAVLALCGLAILRDFTGALPYLTTLIGAYYNNDYLEILSASGTANRLREYAVSGGFGFPVPAFKTLVNLTFEYKHRAADPNPLIKENYFGISLGVNFNEMWFRQSKIY